MKKFLISTLVILLLYLSINLVKPNNYNNIELGKYNYTIYTDEKDIITNSDVIVTGKVNKSTIKNIDINLSTNSDPLYINYYVYDVLITDVIKGNVKIGDTIKVKYPANDIGNGYAKINSYIQLGNNCLLFLESYIDYDENMPYSLVNPTQGIVKFNNKSIDKSLQYSIPGLENFNNKDNLIDYLKNLV